MGKGRKAIPINIKKIKGTYRKDRHKETPKSPSDKKPIPPSRLNKRAKQIFWHMTERLNDIGLATRTNTEAIAELAFWMEEEERFNKLLESDNPNQVKHFFKTKDTSGNDTWKEHPVVRLRDRAAKMVYRYLVEFGLTPASIQKVGSIQKKEKKNEFESF